MEMEQRVIPAKIEIMWNPLDNTGTVRFIAQKITLVDGAVVGVLPAGVEEARFSQLAGMDIDMAGMMPQLNTAFDAVMALREAARQPVFATVVETVPSAPEA
jgi:hypothetical protein